MMAVRIHSLSSSCNPALSLQQYFFMWAIWPREMALEPHKYPSTQALIQPIQSWWLAKSSPSGCFFGSLSKAFKVFELFAKI